MEQQPTSARFSNGLDMTGLGKQIRMRRLQRHLSLDTLSAQSGVSRSMLSDIELGNKVPSVLVLDHIATALGTSIARLLGKEQTANIIVLRRAEQDIAQDASGWERRILSPVLPGVEFEFMRTTISSGADAGTFSPHASGSREYVAIEQGTLQLTLNGEIYLLHSGDSIYYAGDCHHAFTNPGDTPCVFYLVMDVTAHEQQPHHF
ncbi:transcriptional regulator [Reticulibacter mediterranei]|uniref:Transcriptional regulator n=1 Tax=Reticulibacter mediterranei TaxID=2778369 RepID=A0A8J3MXJ1_9CHLR|nr:XRE family transcriptional regulator [Reticulibacter mediterranei]GHO91029.1 transcriptional regulator [Reticulibacter mediterranei]